MLLKSSLNDLSEKIRVLKGAVETEEATKQSMILPFFSILGYDIFNPLEFVPEYVADVGIKKGEKVDYAILENGKPIVIIEAKSCLEKLDKHYSQLFRYFSSTEAKIAILTNGLEYMFYGDLEKPNIMDSKPFLVLNMLDLDDNALECLEKLTKDGLDVNSILLSASELKYTNLVTEWFKREFENPSDEFVKFIMSSGIYEGLKTKKATNDFKTIVKRGLVGYIGKTFNESIGVPDVVNLGTKSKGENKEKEDDGIVTTEDELAGFEIVKTILSKYVDASRISYKDTKSRFNVLLDGKTTKWICYFKFNKSVFHVIIAEDRVIEFNRRTRRRHSFKSLDEIWGIEDELVASLRRYLDNSIKDLHDYEVSEELLKPY